MKILILQLARLGDIYMTWPAIRAVRRIVPNAEIHLVTRPRFEGALEGLTAVDKHHVLPSAHILEPLVQQDADLETSVNRMEEFTETLRAENFDQIINLTFSPFSSYLTHSLTTLTTQVLGYTRFRDGYFCAADDISGYFYAQVGIDKPNRVHVADIFASMMGVEYAEEDWASPVLPEVSFALPETYVAVHVGASEAHKSIPGQAWGRTISYITKRFPGLPFVLIGSKAEQEIAQDIIATAVDANIVNLVGQTRMAELFTVIDSADLLLGCDSAPIHMASLTDTPTLNVSVGKVNFWETGPKATLGFIYRIDDLGQFAPERLGEITARLLEGHVDDELISRTSGLVSYEKKGETAADRFQWELVQAIYLGGTYPLAERLEVIQGAMKLDEINDFIMSQIEVASSKGIEAVAALIENGEEVIKAISRLVPELSPLISWYHTEKVRIAPGTQEELCAATLNVHERFKQHLRVYIPQDEETVREEIKDGTL